MKKKILALFLVLTLLFLSSCDIIDTYFGEGSEDAPEHEHTYGDLLSDAISHYTECPCGNSGINEPHSDANDDGICDVCAYVVRNVLIVSVSADSIINLTSSIFSVERGGSLTFSVSLSSAYALEADGAEIIDSEPYGDLVIYTLSREGITTDITVTLSAILLPICQHEWQSADCTAPTTCTACGEIKGEPLGHDMSAPDCDTASICMRCGATDGEPLGHTMTDPDCETPATCSRCGITDGEPLEHDIVPITCTTHEYCAKCGMIFSLALGHRLTAPTCTTPATCSVCGIIEGTTLPHDMSEATCTGASTCSGCGKAEGEPLGHDMSEATCTSVSTCSRCGITEGTTLAHNMSKATCTSPATCLVCGITEGTATSHDYSNYLKVDPTCTDYGYEQYSCNCGKYYTELLTPLGHSGGKPTYTSEGICTKCNERYLPMLKLTYCSYGAVGDGKTDDFEAIKAAHAYANANGITVYADSGKTFNLGQHADAITIKTSTVWDGATFIIDDREIGPNDAARGRNIFYVAPDYSSYNVRIEGSLTKGQQNIGATFKTPVLLYISNSNVKQYIRYGANANSGANQQELILVDENGNVDPSTPIMWNYDTVTSAIAYPVGDAPITISGGTFITRANAAPREYTYYARNISIKRSNVTVSGITHLITDEGDTGAPYNGFLNITYCNNVMIENTVFTGHKVYKLSSDVNNSMGTYDIALNSANAITFKNCRQTNSITDTTFWGVMGSNYCKNLTYDGCIFSRFDAHQGTYNATIKNSEIGHQKLSVIGQGTLYIENTVFHSDTVVALRSDYGSTWEGEVIFKDITINNTGTPILINAGWVNHYFGYTCHLPERIVVDGVTLANKDYFYVLPNLGSQVDDATVDGAANKNPLSLTKTIVIKSNPNNYKYYVSVNKELFAGVEVIVEK